MDMVFRALAIYLFLVIVFKVAGRRALLQMTSFDLILLLIISEATQQALLGEDFSVTGAMITITTLVVVDIIFGLLKKYFSTVENILDGTPVILVENGVPLADKLKKAYGQRFAVNHRRVLYRRQSRGCALCRREHGGIL